MTTLTREQIRDLCVRLKYGEDYSDREIDALCDLALQGLEQNSAARVPEAATLGCGLTEQPDGVASAPAPAEPHYLARWMDAQCKAAGFERWFEYEGIVIFERPGEPGFITTFGPVQVITPAEPYRRLFDSDSYCPRCGHNRDKSCVSTIDHGDGIKECQKCRAMWVEASSPPQENKADPAPSDAGRKTPDSLSRRLPNNPAAGGDTLHFRTEDCPTAADAEKPAIKATEYFKASDTGTYRPDNTPTPLTDAQTFQILSSLQSGTDSVVHADFERVARGALSLLEEWQRTEYDYQDEEFEPWLESFGNRIDALKAAWRDLHK